MANQSLNNRGAASPVNDAAAAPATSVDRFRARLRHALAWRRGWLRDWCYHRLARLGPTAFVNLRWPWPLRKPYQRDQLLLAPPGGGIGDSLMCTPIFREIKRRNPGCHITFLTKHPSLFEGTTAIKAITPNSQVAAAQAIRLSYDHFTPLFAGTVPPAGPAPAASRAALPHREFYRGYRHPLPPSRPLIGLMAECVGLCFCDDQLDCAPPQVGESLRQQLAAIPPPVVVVQTCASDWTPNKEWPAEHWETLVDGLTSTCSVVEVGTQSSLRPRNRPKRFHSLVGNTTVSELAYIVSVATVFVGPVSAGMHLANAFRVPAVIIYGGYESPDSYRYPRTAALFSPLPCAPCWLTTPCPYDRKCLRMISPAQVLSAVEHLRAGASSPPRA